MRFLSWLTDHLHSGSSRGWEKNLPPAKEKGDFRGHYGFGRRAHRPDPNAKYSFGDNPARRIENPGSR